MFERVVAFLKELPSGSADDREHPAEPTTRASPRRR